MPRAAAEPERHHSEIVVYGGTAAGVAAAVQAARMRHSVILVEPGRHLGGMTTSGLGATDLGNKRAIGGIAREFYRRLGRHYARPEAWVAQSRADYQSGRQDALDDAFWTFEPRVAERVLGEMIAETGVILLLQERLDLAKGVERGDNRILSLTMESGTRLTAKLYIDATYEGDLLARAGVRYHVGREANAVYQETLNGVQTGNAVKHQFLRPVDPFRVPGDRTSGLLPGIHDGPPGVDGQGDARVQAYNFRLCLTDDPRNKMPFPKPQRYDPLRYELLRRYIDAGVWDAFCSNIPMPNRKSDMNNCGAFSSDNIGMNYDYPEGDYARRQAIVSDHVDYQQGLMWFLSNDPRLPRRVRDEVGRWGLCRDEFVDSGGWPYQLYIREARRMVSDYVMTQQNCQGTRVAEDPVGLAAYTMDSHNVQRYVHDGQTRNEGDVQVGGFPPYPISYRAIVPAATECQNLLVPVCLSASHIAYGSIRMEPVFMVLGQSAATAAVHSLEERCPVQSIDYPRLRQRLLRDGQVLRWPAEANLP
jgi:hypothetical protein